MPIAPRANWSLANNPLVSDSRFVISLDFELHWGVFDHTRLDAAGRTYFDRGARGVQEAIADVERTTMRHITYIGEWHTHPAGSTSAPSSLDRTLLNWVADLRQLFLMPGLLLILGDDGLRVVVEKAGQVEESILAI